MEQQKDVIFAVVETVNHPNSPQQTQPNSFHQLLLRMRVQLKGKAYQKNTEENTSAEMCVHWICGQCHISVHVKEQVRKRARVQDDDFLFSICPCCEDMMFLQPSGAFMAQPGLKHNPHTDHEALAEDRAAQRPTEKPSLDHGLPLYTSSRFCVCFCDRFQCTDTDNSLVLVC